MTVYLAYHGYDYDGDTVIGVFDNLDAAVACCRNVYNGTWTKGQTWNETYNVVFPDIPFEARTKGSYVRIDFHNVLSTFGE